MSSNNGLDIGALIATYEPDHVIVKSYQAIELGGKGGTYTIHQAQMTRSRGCTVGAYVWLYAGIDGGEQVDDALAVASAAGIVLGPTNPLWLDCEDYTDGSYPSLDVIRQASDECRRRGMSHGIYTAAWWWVPRTGNSIEFANLPLWYALYDGEEMLGDPGFGGWTEATAAGHQWSGAPVDRSIFKAEFAS